MDWFEDFCGMLTIHGAIDVTQIHVQKLKTQVLVVDSYH
jgi:hypothetical protein